MKKRIVSTMLALTLAASLLTGCGKTGERTDGSENETSTGMTEEEKTPEDRTDTENAAGGTTNAGEAGDSQGASSADTDPSGDQATEEPPLLKDAVTDIMGCRVGCAATEGELMDEKVWEIITTHFNAITFGNELKPDALVGYSLSSPPGLEMTELNGEMLYVPKLDYSRAERMLDKFYDWNAEHPDDPILVKGHVLVWHAQTPEWFFHEDYDKNAPYADKETMDKRLEWYIREVLTHFTGEDSKYKDMFYGWDVVNEACSDGGHVYRTDSENPDEALSEDRHGSNSSWWHVYQSNEYIINAFIYANKYAPPGLELYYNDYNECAGTKVAHITELLQEVKSREGEPGVGTRIDAMGMQGHYNMESPKFDELDWAIRRYADVVGTVQFSELDLKASADYDGSDAAKEKEYKAQYGRYKTLYTIMQTTNEDENINVSGITFWGTADHYSWLQSSSNVGGGATGNLPQCPLLFDENYQIKPCFYAFTEKKFQKSE